MTDPPFALLETMASKSEQIHWMITGPADERIFPYEILREAASFCTAAAISKFPSTSRMRDAIHRLSIAIDGSGDFLEKYDHVSLIELVENDPTWALIRDCAAEVLSLFEAKPWD